MRLPSNCVCLVTGRHRAAPDARTDRDALLSALRLIEAAADAGLDLVQVREPDLAACRLADFVRDVVRSTAGSRTQVVVNERADVAAAADAAGVHLRRDSAGAARVRALRKGWLIGRSVHPGTDPREPDLDYVIFGTMASTPSKPISAPLANLDALASAVAESRVPVLAIGGMTPALAERCGAAGALGVAAISAFLPVGTSPGALGPSEAVSALREALARGRGRRRHGAGVGG